MSYRFNEGLGDLAYRHMAGQIDSNLEYFYDVETFVTTKGGEAVMLITAGVHSALSEDFIRQEHTYINVEGWDILKFHQCVGTYVD